MKFLIAFSFIVVVKMSFAQEYSDTIYYKSGTVRSAEIISEGNRSIKYSYISATGRIMKTSARITMLEWYSIDGVRNSLEPEFNATNLGYRDTIYYKSGQIRVGEIIKESKVGIRYRFVNADGRISKSMARKSLLKSYTVGDKRSTIAKDWESKN